MHSLGSREHRIRNKVWDRDCRMRQCTRPVHVDQQGSDQQGSDQESQLQHHHVDLLYAVHHN